MSFWDNDELQFARLLSELNMAGAFTEEVIGDLCISMDLTPAEIHTLIVRAERRFEKAIQNLDIEL